MITASKLNNNEIEFSQRGKMLGLLITNRGIIPHIRERIKLANILLQKIKRFSGCTEGIKIQLYKSLIRPIIEYPPVPLNTASNTQKLKIQSIQNKALIWASGARYPDIPSAEELHDKYNLLPMNLRIHHLARKTWEKLEYLEDVNYCKISDAHLANENHSWFPRSLPLTLVEPRPLYSKRSLPRRDRHAVQDDPDDPDDP